MDSPNKADRIADEKLWQLVKVSVSAAIRMAIDVSSDGKTLPQYSNYPIIERNNDGSFRGRSMGPAPDCVPNYGRIFGHRDGSNLPGPTFYTYDQVPGYADLREYLTVTPPYARFYSPYRSVNEKSLQRRQEIAIFDLVAGLCNRYIALNGLTMLINEESLREEYCRLERWISSSELPVDVLIPIIGSSFDLDYVSLGDCSIERLDEHALAQLWPSEIAHRRNWIYAAPSHCLVISDFKISNVGYFRWLDHTPEVELPDTVSRFFQALQLATGRSNVGYAHYGYRPVGWSNSFMANLETLICGPIDEQYRQNEAVTVSPLSEDDYQLFVSLFRKFDGLKPNVAFGAKKYRSAFLRNDEADTIVDLCIALESILGDRGETTHKLAIRVATIFSDQGWVGCDEIYNNVKKIYLHRSDLVHGNRNAEPSRTIGSVFGEEYTTLDIARLVAREVIIYAVHRGQLTGNEIDKILLSILAEHAERPG